MTEGDMDAAAWVFLVGGFLIVAVAMWALEEWVCRRCLRENRRALRDIARMLHEAGWDVEEPRDFF
jgi:hypothetical protein